jgi:ribosomal protein S24E
MSNGFGGGTTDGKAKVYVQKEEVEKLIKEYKKIKKYMKSPIFAVKNLDGTEQVVKELLDKYGDENI